MAHIFTSYPENSDDILETSEISKDAEIKKLRKKNKKLKKTIRKLRKCGWKEGDSLDMKKRENDAAKVRQNEANNFSSMMKDVALKVLPNMLRTFTKIVTSALCEWAFKRSGKWQAA